MAVIAGATSVAHACNTLFGSSSKPVAFLTLMLRMSFSTSSTPICRCEILASTWSERGGTCWIVSSLVNTDRNCWMRFFPLPLQSLTRWPSSRSGAIPILSSIPDLTYFQKGFGLLRWRPSSMMLFICVHLALRMIFFVSFWHILY